MERIYRVRVLEVLIMGWAAAISPTPTFPFSFSFL